VNTRFIDWIWHVRGSLALAPEQSTDEAFNRLEPLFRETGTSRERRADTLVFSKKDAAAQDKMSVFDRGVLQIESGATGAVLHYQLFSRALLFCFLAPLLFLGFAQLNIALGKIDKPSTEAAADASKKSDKKKPAVQLNPIDKFLGAPEPDKKDGAGKDEDKAKKKHSPTPAYVFAGIFAALYVVGRILEDRLAKSLFRKRLLDM
jgi:hypothetical protein